MLNKTKVTTKAYHNFTIQPNFFKFFFYWPVCKVVDKLGIIVNFLWIIVVTLTSLYYAKIWLTTKLSRICNNTFTLLWFLKLISVSLN